MVRDRILLIDEDPNLLISLKTLLEERNFEVETAQDRAQVFRHLAHQSFSVLITEYLLEHTDTGDIIHRVKATSPETYIIMVTGAVIDEVLRENLVDLGVDDLFIKPSPIEDVVIAVKKALRTRQMAMRVKRLREQVNVTRTQLREASEGYFLDPLTGSAEYQIFNDRYLRDQFNRELGRARRHERELSVLFLNLTKPQKVKGLGPRKTDQYLMEMAKMVRKNTRAEDTVARRHEGFALILPETESKGTGAVMKRLKGLIQAHAPFLTDPEFEQLNRRWRFTSYSYPEQPEVPALE
jgi:diguanylate cyclase (GGDEF)-like protein